MDTLAEVVEASLRSVEIKPQDAGAGALALTYAKEIDNGTGDVAKLGPALLACLESLLMTPRARAAVVKGLENEPKQRSPLDELRRRREERRAG